MRTRHALRTGATTAAGHATMLQLPVRLLALAVAALASLASLLIAIRSADAQIVNFRHYTAAEGMPQSQVLAMEQDHLGYMWFGTYGGLTRFDGGEFVTYTKEDGLSSNAVYDIAEDERGRLLLATSGGLCVREAARFTCTRQSDGLVDDDARAVASDRAGGAWVGTARGLSHVSAGGKKIRNYTRADGLPGDRVRRIVVDDRRRVWVATEKGLARLVGDRFVREASDVIGDTAVQFIAASGSELLVGVGRRLFVRSDSAMTPLAPGAIPDSASVIDGAVDADGTAWVATRVGALRIRDGQVQQVRRTNGLLTDLLIRVLVDREQNVWFGTENGASKHVPGPFRTYTELEGLPNPFVRAISTDAEGRLWTGGRNGVAVREGERFRTVPLPGIPDNRVYSLAPAPGGGMLIGTRKGLVWYNAGRIRLYREEVDGMPGDVAFGLRPDGRGGVWIGTERGLARWENGVVTPVTSRPELAGLNIISLATDRRGRLWIGRTAGGVAVLDRDSLRFLGPKDGITDQTVWAMQEDARGRMWVATNGDGVLVVDGDQVRRYTTRDGLASNFVWQVLSDSSGDVWLFGNLGLDRFSGEKLTHYGRGSGLIELEGSAGASFEDRDGNRWFGTGLGVVRYNEQLDVARADQPPVFVEDAMSDGTPLSLAQDRLRLEHGAVRIRFASPSFRDETATRFSYRLIGVDDSWSAPTADRSISYAGLAPGSYRFEVVAENGALRSARPAVLAFDVLPAFWQTWWFRTLAVALLLGAAAVIPSLRARTLERERRRLEALVAQHTRDLADKNQRLEQSNRDLEHFAYVASHDLQEPLRKIQAFSDRVSSQYSTTLDEQGRDYLGRMSKAAARMQRLIEALLTLSRVTTKKNPIEPVELDAVAHDVVGDLEIRILSTNGRVELGALPRIAGDPVQLRQVFQNLIGNALKFHRPDEDPVVRVSAVSRDARWVEIAFEDNGIGFESKDAEKVFLPFLRLHGRAQYEGTGIGLTICQKIAERHGGTIRAESVPGQGSRFVVTLPVHGPVGERHAA